jgi:hypothetical protein
MRTKYEYTFFELDEMNLKQYKIGTVVHVSQGRNISLNQVGHILGFRIIMDEFLVEIKLPTGIEFYAPHHITIF